MRQLSRIRVDDQTSKFDLPPEEIGDKSECKNGSGAISLKVFSRYDGDECLLFPFRTAAKPRGVVTYNFTAMDAHRAMCITVNKLPSEGKPMALHHCGNGHLGCVTPKHLYWGSASENNKDAHRHAVEGKPEAVLDIELMRRRRR